MATSKRAARSKPEAIALLMQDHRKVEKLVQAFKKIDDEDAKEFLVRTVCDALKVHTQLEEQVFYPAARERIDETDLLDEAQVEHNAVKDLIAKLERMRPGDPLYSATFTVLGEYVRHHVQEEEKEMFPKVAKAKMDFEMLAEAMRERKLQLRVELDLPESEQDENADLEARFGRLGGRARRSSSRRDDRTRSEARAR
jgi:hemerythrin superfamily protein